MSKKINDFIIVVLTKTEIAESGLKPSLCFGYICFHLLSKWRHETITICDVVRKRDVGLDRTRFKGNEKLINKMTLFYFIILIILIANAFLNL